MRKYIIFMAEDGQPNWEERKLQHTGGCTDILTEYYDSSDSPIAIGYRPTEYKQEPEFVDPQFSGATTHQRRGEWEVQRIESYVPDLPLGTNFNEIVICYCIYNPIESPWTLQSKPAISIESFGGDREALDRYTESQKYLTTA